MDHVVLDLKIVVDEVSWEVAGCDDTTHFCRREDDVIWFLGVEEFLDLWGVKEVQFLSGTEQELVIWPLGFKGSN